LAVGRGGGDHSRLKRTVFRLGADAERRTQFLSTLFAKPETISPILGGKAKESVAAAFAVVQH